MPSNPSPEPPHPVNYVFLDFENVPEIDLSLIGNKAVVITILLGASQKKLDAALVEKLMEHTASVQLIRLTSSGKNALDFALAYYVGRAAMADPTGYFHIVAKDKGYDPLIEHLRSRNLRARRHSDFSTLTFSGPSKPASAMPKEFFPRALAHLRKNTTNRPKRKKTLVAHLKALCGNGATENNALALIASLQKAGHVSIGENDAVTYDV